MTQVTVVAQVTARREAVELVKSELLKLIEPTRKEIGCITYNLHQDSANPELFIFYETWENLHCLENHMKTAHFLHYVAAVTGLIEGKVVHKLTRIA